MIFIEEYKLLVVSYTDSTLRIYNEEDSEESTLLKVLSGGHCESEITCTSFCEMSKFIASGSLNGIFSLWNILTGKLEFSHQIKDQEITVISFLSPYPAIAVGTNKGELAIWGTITDKVKFRY